MKVDLTTWIQRLVFFPTLLILFVVGVDNVNPNKTVERGRVIGAGTRSGYYLIVERPNGERERVTCNTTIYSAVGINSWVEYERKIGYLTKAHYSSVALSYDPDHISSEGDRK